MNETVNISLETVEPLCMKVLSESDFTADEVAELIGRSILAVRPVITILGQDGYIVRTGKKRPNYPSGKMADVWVVNTNKKYNEVVRNALRKIPARIKRFVEEAKVSVEILKELGHSPEKIKDELKDRWTPEAVSFAIHSIFQQGA